MPALPVSLLEPLWAQFAALLPDRPVVDPSHPLGCHRRRIPDRVVFEHVVAALVHGSGHERIASPGCSDRTIRRRVHAWATAGLMPHLHTLVLAQYDLLIGVDLRHVCVDGCITKAPGGGVKAGCSPVDRGKQGRKRSLLTDANGIPLHLVAAGANCPDSHLLRETRAGLSTLGAPANRTAGAPGPWLCGTTGPGYAGRPRLCWRDTAAVRPGTRNVGERWVVECTHSWLNAFGGLRRCSERSSHVVDLDHFLAASIIVIHQLLRAAAQVSRWPMRSTTRRLR